SVRSFDAGTIQRFSNGLLWMTSSESGSRASSKRAATVAVRGSDSTYAGPKKPWLRDACGSRSQTSTFRPRRAKWPARWKTLDVFPTPPLRFKNDAANENWSMGTSRVYVLPVASLLGRLHRANGRDQALTRAP